MKNIITFILIVLLILILFILLNKKTIKECFTKQKILNDVNSFLSRNIEKEFNKSNEYKKNLDYMYLPNSSVTTFDNNIVWPILSNYSDKIKRYINTGITENTVETITNDDNLPVTIMNFNLDASGIEITVPPYIDTSGNSGNSGNSGKDYTVLWVQMVLPKLSILNLKQDNSGNLTNFGSFVSGERYTNNISPNGSINNLKNNDNEWYPIPFKLSNGNRKIVLSNPFPNSYRTKSHKNASELLKLINNSNSFNLDGFYESLKNNLFNIDQMTIGSYHNILTSYYTNIDMVEYMTESYIFGRQLLKLAFSTNPWNHCRVSAMTLELNLNYNFGNINNRLYRQDGCVLFDEGMWKNERLIIIKPTLFSRYRLMNDISRNDASGNDASGNINTEIPIFGVNDPVFIPEPITTPTRTDVVTSGDFITSMPDDTVGATQIDISLNRLIDYSNLNPINSDRLNVTTSDVIFRIPFVNSGKDKILYFVEHNDNWTPGTISISIMFLDRYLFVGNLYTSFNNPFARHFNSKKNSKYMALIIPKEVLPPNNFITIKINVFSIDHAFYIKEVGTHDVEPSV
jgi:hypothetical protein